MSDVKALPHLPGVYFFKDQHHSIIYIGKAKDLRKRVQSYFTNQKTDWKVAELIKEHASIKHIVTKSEHDALLLEAQLIRDYKPKYNVLLKSGQPFVYLLFTETKTGLPNLEVVRNKNKKGRYFGPFLHKRDAYAVYNYLMRTFRLNLCNKTIENGCLDYHIGRCAGNCRANFDASSYLTRLDLAYDALKGNHKEFLARLTQQIARLSTALEFEKAAHLSIYIKNFDTIFTTIQAKFHDKKYGLEIEHAAVAPQLPERDFTQALIELQQLLKLEKTPRTIDCFDISHFQSNAIVGSCIRFTDGKKDPNYFRRFKVKSLKQQNDYAALQEIVLRRYRNRDELPDIIFIDGGKGQRNAIAPFFDIPCISLAKREELLITDYHPEGIPLDLKNPLGQLLIAIRDYAHHFAVSYHRLRRKNNLSK